MNERRSTAWLLAALVSVAGCGGPPADGRLHVVLVVIDTTRSDAVGDHEGAPSPTPNLDRLAAEGVRYTHARTTGAWTLPSHASLFTGLHVARHGAHWDHRGLDDSLTTLAELLQPSHETVGFSENPHIIRDTGFAQGFDHFDETWRFQRAFGVDPQTLEQVERWLGKRDPSRPFFLFVNLMTAHLPFTPPARFEKRLRPPGARPELIRRLWGFGEDQARLFMAGGLELDDEELRVLRGLYRAEVAYVDEQVGRLLDAVERRVPKEQTLVAVVSDHGENLGEHGLMEHQLCLYETLLRVPLILRLPGSFEGGERRAAPVQLTDLLPTILDAAGVALPGDLAVDGSSLVEADPPAERPLLAEFRPGQENRRLFRRARPGFDFDPFDRRLWSVQRGDLKLILSDRGDAELYDLSRDPGETRNLAGERPEDVRRLAGDVLRGDSAPAGAGAEPAFPLDDETREMLRRLGYVE